MSGNLFIPKMNREEHFSSSETKGNDVVLKNNRAGEVLQKVSQYAVILLIGLLPIFFTPGLNASLGFDKSLLTIGFSFVVFVTSGFLMLRRMKVKTIIPVSLLFFWSVVVTALVSGLLSGDTQDSLRGSVVETQTVAFLAVIGLAMTIPLVLQGSKKMSLKAFIFFGLTTALLFTYNILRLVFGPELLNFSSFGAVTISPIGGFNDLAIIAGMTIIFGLITLVQLPLRIGLQSVIAGLLLCSLVLLSVINFFAIWLVVGFFSLLLLLYSLSRDVIFQTDKTTVSTIKNSRILFISAVVICIVSTIFIVAGDAVGGKISQITGVEYIEVRPSPMATLDVAKSVYNEDILFGIGPNRFSDAWRLYKDTSINQTVFWDTDFNSGSSFITTLFVNVGLLGGILILLFHSSFLYLGYKMFLRSNYQDPFWYFFGLVSFAVASFVWGISYVYVPGAGILLLGAVFTGLTYVAAGSLLPDSVRSVPLVVNRRRGFSLMAVVILLLVISVLSLVSFGKQYVAKAGFTKAQMTSVSLSDFEQRIIHSFDLYPDSMFIGALAQMKLSEFTANLNLILNSEEPTEEMEQKFLKSAQSARAYAEKAVALDGTNPGFLIILAGVYSNLALAGLGEAQGWSETALNQAVVLDPTNPGYHLISAQINARIGDVESSKEDIKKSLKLKPNFTEALFFSTQLDVNQGETESAIETTKLLISLEPNNAARYFQIGILFAATEDVQGAINAFKLAVRIDSQYANARYLLAQAYLINEQPKLALEQLKLIEVTNPDNQQLLDFIAQVESGDYEIPDTSTFVAPVKDSSPQEVFENTVVTDEDIDTDLINTVNTVSNSDDSETPAENNEDTQFE